MKENQRIALTKKLLKETLLRLLRDKELSKISITELCRESEINRATFYRHYSEPKDVLSDIQSDSIKALYAATKYIKTEEDAERFLEHLCFDFYENSVLIKYFMENNLDGDIEILLSKFFQSILKFQNKLNADVSEENISIINAYLAGGACSVFKKWTKGEIHKTPKEISQIVLKLLNGDYNLQ